MNKSADKQTSEKC